VTASKPIEKIQMLLCSHTEAATGLPDSSITSVRKIEHHWMGSAARPQKIIQMKVRPRGSPLYHPAK